MEFKNPLDEMIWLLGEWKGQLKINEIDTESSFKADFYGREFISYEIKIVKGKKTQILEEGYFFYDKIEEKILTHSFFEEGFSEISDWILVVLKDSYVLNSQFQKGYNLPPNMELKKEINYNHIEQELKYTLKLGKMQQPYISAVFKK